jgi:REP element-mobilizing transposase RayT
VADEAAKLRKGTWFASHIVFGVYGFWLPNDPRGSWSEFVGACESFRFRPATKVETRISLAHRPHDRAARRAAQQALTGGQARAVGRGFTASARKGGATLLACAILLEHIHLVVARHRCKVDWIVNQLKGAATRQLLEESLHSFAQWRRPEGRVPMCWAPKTSKRLMGVTPAEFRDLHRQRRSRTKAADGRYVETDV